MNLQTIGGSSPRTKMRLKQSFITLRGGRGERVFFSLSLGMIMNNMLIKVKVPELREKWRFSIGSSTKRRNSVAVVYNQIERRLSRLPVKEKTAIRVIYDKPYVNETIKSLDARYLLFCMTCFLEEYMDPNFLRIKMRNYANT